MNTSRHWFCPDCKGAFGMPVIRVQDWDGRCLVCGNDEGLVVAGDVNPNDPDKEEKDAEIQARLRELGWTGPSKVRKVRATLREAAGKWKFK